MRRLAVFVAIGCGGTAKPPGPAAEPKAVLAEGGGAGCSDGWRQFADRGTPPRFVLCAPHGTRIGWMTGSDGLGGTVDLAYVQPDDSARLSISVMSRALPQGHAQDGLPPDARFDFDRSDDQFAGHPAQHYLVRFHVHRERSYDLDEHGDHPAHDETSDHDQVTEVWLVQLAAGTLQVALATQDNTSEATARLLRRIGETIRL